jgi:tight adherence protein C
MSFTNIPIIMIIGISFVAFFTLAIGVGQLLKAYAKRRDTIQKIKYSRDKWQEDVTFEEEGQGSLFKTILAALSRSGARFSSDRSSRYSATRLKLLRAGIRNQRAVSIFWGVKIWLPVVLVIVFFMLRLMVFRLIPAQAAMIVGVLLGILGFYGPDIVMAIKAYTRRAKIVEGLPDALDLLVVCVEAGLGLDSAFNRVADEMKLTNKALSSEFKMLNLELRAGKPRQEALRNLSLRANVESLNSLVTLMIQTDKFGTSVAKALQVFSDSFRTQRFQKAEEIAAKLPVKMVFPLVLFIFPSFMAVMMGPAIIEIYEKFILR